jgi:hypothetical protein
MGIDFGKTQFLKRSSLKLLEQLLLRELPVLVGLQITASLIRSHSNTMPRPIGKVTWKVPKPTHGGRAEDGRKR